MRKYAEYGGIMQKKDEIKRIIAEELAHFLISDAAAPDHIDIHLSYKNSRANLHIDCERIAEILKK